MQCEVCTTQYESTDANLRFCSHCGWPLCRLEVAIEPADKTAILVGTKPVSIILRCRNRGHGSLPVSLGTLPDGVSLTRSLPEELTVASEAYPITLLIDPVKIGASLKRLEIPLMAQDRAGTHAEDFRPEEADLTQHHPIVVQLERKVLGPVYVLHPSLLFRRRQREQSLWIKNMGEITDKVKVISGQNYRVRRPGEEAQSALTLEIRAGGNSEEVIVEAVTLSTKGEPLSEQLVLEGASIPGGRQAVKLSGVSEVPFKEPTERWIISIDFGTAKTAVFFIDTYYDKNRPHAIEWVEIIDNEKHFRQTTPSVVLYPASGGFPSFGWQVPEYTALGDERIFSIKKRLLEDREYYIPTGERVEGKLQKRPIHPPEIVEDYLRFLVDHVRKFEAFREMGNPFEDACVVMTLPVRDKEGFEQQKARTEEAARKAGITGTILFYSEPECAAFDFLQRATELKLNFKNGDLMCVFDMGAGTTDICLLQVFTDSNPPRFRVLGGCGFPFIGGDTIDNLIVKHLLDNYFESEEEKASINYSALVRDVRKAKEGLPLNLSPEEARKIEGIPLQNMLFQSKNIEVRIDWNLIETVFKDYIERMLTHEEGFPEGFAYPDAEMSRSGTLKEETLAKRWPSLKRKLLDEKRAGQTAIDLNEVNWLCITGGSSFIPSLLQHLQQNVFPFARMIPNSIENAALLVLQENASHKLNVVRGAVVRPLYRQDGLLNVAFSVVLETRERVYPANANIPVGSSPGTMSREQRFLWPDQEGPSLLHVVAETGDLRENICTLPLVNPYGEESHLYVRLRFGYDESNDLVLTLNVAAMYENERQTIAEDFPVLCWQKGKRTNAN